MERPVSEDQSAAAVVNTGTVSASDELNPPSPEIFVCNLHFVQCVNMHSAWLHYRYSGRVESLWRMRRHGPVIMGYD